MLVISRSHPPELFEIAKEALDNITFLIQSHISLPWLARIFSGRNNRHSPGLIHRFYNAPAIIALIRQDMIRLKPSCPIPDDHIAPSRSALFLAWSVLRSIRNGGYDANQAA